MLSGVDSSIQRTTVASEVFHRQVAGQHQDDGQGNAHNRYRNEVKRPHQYLLWLQKKFQLTVFYVCAMR